MAEYALPHSHWIVAIFQPPEVVKTLSLKVIVDNFYSTVDLISSFNHLVREKNVTVYTFVGNKKSSVTRNTFDRDPNFFGVFVLESGESKTFIVHYFA